MEINSMGDSSTMYTYEYTATDFAEMNAAHARFFAAPHGGKPSRRSPGLRFGRGLVSWVAFVTLAIMLIYVVSQRSPSPPNHPAALPLPTHNYLRTVLPLWVPMLFMTAFIGYFIIRAIGPKSVPFYKAPTPIGAPSSFKTQVMVVWLPLLVAIAIIFVRTRLPAKPDWTPTTLSLIVAAGVPYIAMFLLFWFHNFRVLRRAGRSPIPGAEGGILRQVQTLQLIDRGLVFSTPVSKLQYDWAYFVSYLESENVILIYDRDLNVHLIPKRAFPTPDLFDMFCGTVQNHISSGQFLPRQSAFPVVAIRE